MNRNMMSRRLVGGIALSLLAMGLFSTQALAQVGGFITSSKHNLTSGGLGTSAYKFTAATGAPAAEVCVFCHTPHGAAIDENIPLWNRSYVSAGYTTYASLNTVTTQGATLTVGSISLACLSCHDGGQAMNVVINTPGSGTTTTYAGTWSGANTTGLQTLAAGPWSFIGKDLTNDHPISVQYGGGPATGVTTMPAGDYTVFKDADFNTVKSNGLATTAQRWWLDMPVFGGVGGTAGTRDRTDILLYGRTGATFATNPSATSLASTTYQPYVECGSCHDPHNAGAATFLRNTNGGSAICLACHKK